MWESVVCFLVDWLIIWGSPKGRLLYWGGCLQCIQFLARAKARLLQVRKISYFSSLCVTLCLLMPWDSEGREDGKVFLMYSALCIQLSLRLKTPTSFQDKLLSKYFFTFRKMKLKSTSEKYYRNFLCLCRHYHRHTEKLPTDNFLEHFVLLPLG